MKKLLLLAISLPMGLSAMDNFFNHWPKYTDLLNPKVYINRTSKQHYSVELSCHLDQLFDFAKDVKVADLKLGEEQRNHYGCYLKDVIQEGTGNTLLHAMALCNGSPDTVKYLLTIGVDPLQRNSPQKNENEGQTALDIARENDNGELIAALVEATSNRMPPQEKPEHSTENDNNEPSEREDEKKATWFKYVTIERSILAAVGIYAVHYLWQQYTANEKTTA